MKRSEIAIQVGFRLNLNTNIESDYLNGRFSEIALLTYQMEVFLKCGCA